MGEIVTGADHGSIDLNPLLQAVIDCLKKDPGNLIKESKGKVYAVTDEIIREIMENQPLMADMRREGRLFDKTKYADAIATNHKSPRIDEQQMKRITEMEGLIDDRLRSLLKGQESEFFGQQASSCFDALRKLTGKNADIVSDQSSPFPDADLTRKYPGTKATLRVPYHTIQMSGQIIESLADKVKQAVRMRLSDESPEDEIDSVIETVENDLSRDIGRLSSFIRVLDRNAYGRIRRTYACCVLNCMSEFLPEDSPSVRYIRRVCDFNELVQGTLPDSGFSADDLVVEFPTPYGRGTMDFDLMAEFIYADALNPLPFWITFSELVSEVTTEDSVTTTMGQHIKMNGKVASKGFDSVFEYHLDKLVALAEAIRSALEAGRMPPDENVACRVLRIAVMYYVVFRDDPKMYRTALMNYKALKKAVEEWTDEKVGLNEILRRIINALRSTISVNKSIQNDFKMLMASRKLDNHPQNKEKLYLIVSRDILSKPSEMADASPIVDVKNRVTSYLRYLKITRHPGKDDDALIKEELRFTESLRYLTLPETAQQNRWMRRDIGRGVIGLLLTPRNNEMIRLSFPFGGLTKLIISYDRDQLQGITGGSRTGDAYFAGIAQITHLLLVYGVLKAVARMADNYGDAHWEKPMMLMLSLFSTSPQQEKSVMKRLDDKYQRGFTHDAHKAVEHIIRQHIPTKSQGFKMNSSGQWEGLIASGQWRKKYPALKDAAYDHIRRELKDYRYWNIVTGLSSGMDSLWLLPEEPGMKKIGLITLTSRPCDRLRKPSPEDRSILFGHIHRFTHETGENTDGGVCHFYRHQPIQAFCDDLNRTDCFKKPSVLIDAIKNLYKDGFHDVIIVTKVPFTRRIRMTTDDDSTYTNPILLQALHREMPDLRVYPLFTQKSYGVRLDKKNTQYPMFIPPDAENDVTIREPSGKSTLFRAGSVVTCRVVKGGNASEKLHSGITDYLFRCYPETVTIQSDPISALTTPGNKQMCLHEVLRFLHANAFQKSVSRKRDGERPIEAKLDALESIIGENGVGQQADLKFPKPKRGTGGETYTFSVNIIALLKHLENQSDLGRERFSR